MHTRTIIATLLASSLVFVTSLPIPGPTSAVTGSTSAFDITDMEKAMARGNLNAKNAPDDILDQTPLTPTDSRGMFTNDVNEI